MTIRWACTRTRGYRCWSRSAAAQWVVAACPSSTPASAARNAPVHEDATTEPAAAHLATHGDQATFAAKVASTSLDNPGITTSSDRKSTRLNSSHLGSSYAVFCLT